MPRAFARGDVSFHAIREREQPNAVVVTDGAERDECRDFRRDRTFLVRPRAEPLARGNIDEQHERQFAFFDISLDIRGAHAGRHVPVDAANVVTGRVFADFVERQTRALEGGMILAAEQCLHGALGPQLQAANLTHDVGRKHGVNRLGGVASRRAGSASCASALPSRGRTRVARRFPACRSSCNRGSFRACFAPCAGTCCTST